MNFKKVNSTVSLTSEKTPKEFLPPTRSRSYNHIKEIIVSAADESTTHGIDHIFKRSHPFIRFVWVVCFLASSAVCFYMMTISILTYLDYETVTKAEKIVEQTVDFPTVSICNLNPYLTNSSWEYVKSVLIENGLINSTVPTDTFKYLLSNYYNFQIINYDFFLFQYSFFTFFLACFHHLF